VMLARNCLNSSSKVVKYVANYGIYFGRMASGLGRNVFFGCEHFSLALDDLLGKKFNTRCVYDICLGRRTESSYCRATCMLELLMLERDILFVPCGDFSAGDIYTVIHSLCNDWC